MTNTGNTQELAAGTASDYVIAFGKALDDAGGGLDWPYFLEKPCKWENEYALWKSHGYVALGEPGWEAFADALAIVESGGAS